MEELNKIARTIKDLMQQVEDQRDLIDPIHHELIDYTIGYLSNAEDALNKISDTAINENSMLTALKAIVARLEGVYDAPSLLLYGELSANETDDVLHYAKAAIEAANIIND